MTKPHFTQDQLTQVARLSEADIKKVKEYRGEQNKLGFAYQLCYVKLFNRLPTQSPFEPVEELMIFVAVQLGILKELLADYAAQRSTFFRHQEDLCRYLGLKKFDQQEEVTLKSYLFHQALQIQPSESLLIKATDFLREEGFLNPSDDTIMRLIQTQREKARTHIYDKIASELTSDLK